MRLETVTIDIFAQKPQHFRDGLIKRMRVLNIDTQVLWLLTKGSLMEKAIWRTSAKEPVILRHFNCTHKWLEGTRCGHCGSFLSNS